jgi:hypothetical protein
MRGQSDRHVRGAMISIIAVLALAAGCAGRSSSASGTGEAAAAIPAPDLSGTWHGYYGDLGLAYDEDDADCVLRIENDATFTATCTRTRSGTNNLANPSSWSGRATTKGNRVVLQAGNGPWPWIVLTRSGSDTLYGVTLDPLVGATIEMEFKRQPNTAGRAGRS